MNTERRKGSKGIFPQLINKGQGRRYDHIFSSVNLSVNDAFYDHAPREEKLSDHSPLIVELSIR